MAKALPWWQRGAIYQLLVPSFFDTNDDGMGDLPGVTQKLEYLCWLGVDAVWLSPIYASPLEDLGYDVSEFTDIEPRFGTLAELEDLLREAHRRGLKVILDWVPNHTSSEHPWFQGARSSREHPQRDWYIWRDPKPDGSPPNNWLSIFGGSVWEFDEGTGQYYLHTFLKEQPDLNWSNPDVREAVLDAMRFWLDRGVDGFRLDALDLLMKDPQFPDNPPNPNYDPESDGPDMAVLPMYTRDQPAVHDVVAQMRRLVDEYQDRVLLGELYLPIDQIIAFYGRDEPELHLPLQPVFGSLPWTVEELYRLIDPYLGQMPENAWPSWMLSTHDGRRVASRAGAAQAPVAAMMLLTLPGTPIIYYGDEIGMHDVEVPPEKERDPQGKRIGRKRDPVRTPMQWNDWIQAGFTSGEPWLPIADDYEETNVDNQSEARSLLTLYRRLLALRTEIATLVSGSFVLDAQREHIISYRREDDERRLLILLNLGSEPQTVELDERGERNRVLLSTFLDRENEEVENAVELRGDEGLILTT
jgi:alpha-glucosidase